MALVKRVWPLVVLWAVLFGVIVSLIADWGKWDRFFPNLLWRVIVIACGGIGGLIMNIFAGSWVSMGTNVIESMRITRFSDDTQQKIENTFIFVGAIVGAIVAWIFIR